ncbi:MAG: hypothetical protein ABS58_17325 [Mesorhizobium sp. SCN 65-20]|nr:MAG: hypothetical protein ABS58_17325 [Mesorhizobium sp. SCN 65-20]
MKTIIMAVAATLILTPVAFAAVPVAKEATSKAAINEQAAKDDVVLLAGGPGRTGAIGMPRGKGFLPGKGWGG